MDSLMLFADVAQPLSLEMRIPLSILNFLEFAIWGAWYVVLANYLNNLNFSRTEIGRIYATIPLGAVISPLFIGTIADQYFAAENVVGVLHLVGAVLLFWLATITNARKFFWVMLAYALAYMPTLSLSAWVTFANVPDGERDFPTVRVLGTIGWIVVGLSLRFILTRDKPVSNRPLIFAGIISAVLGVYSFFLPHTPPRAQGIAFLQAFDLMSDFDFAAFMAVSLLITLALAFYFSWTALYLESEVKVRPDNVGPLMTIGQWMEIIFLLLLPWFLATIQLKWVLAMGMAAWGIRYAIFSQFRYLPIVLIGVALHGICFDFFFATGFIYVDNVGKPQNIGASAQSLFGVVTYGLGMWLGTEASGWLNQRYTKIETDPETGETHTTTNWTKFWLIPCVGVVVSLILFILLFNPE